MNSFFNKFISLIWIILTKLSGLFKNNYPYFIENINLSRSSNQKKKLKKALILFKTQPIIFNSLSKFYKHTNDWEIIEIIKLLNKNGFKVDAVDRDFKSFVPKKKYNLFIGIGAGNSGSSYFSIASNLKECINVILCLGPDPELSKKNVINRYDFFNQRNNTNAPPMRVPDKVDINKFMSVSDIIWAIGQEGSFGFNSYKKYNLPLYSYLPSISPKVFFDEKMLLKRKMTNFLCFAGNGFICKGVDVLIEAFSQTPELNLSICGPNNETSFFETYEKDLNANNNIKYYGFVYPGSNLYMELINKNSFIVFSSAAEGLATSVLTCMKSGLLPIINYETGIINDNFGYKLIHKNNNEIIPEIIHKCKIASKKNKTKYICEVEKMLNEISIFSQTNFSYNVNEFLKKIDQYVK